MAKLIDVVVKMGRVIPVENTKKRPSEKNEYYCVKTEAVDGGDEKYLLFTKRELKACPIVDSYMLPEYKFPEKSLSNKRVGRLMMNDMKAGRIFPTKKVNIFKITRIANLVKTEEYDKEKKKWYIVVRRISNSRLKRALYRASRNTEDIAKTSWFQNILD